MKKNLLFLLLLVVSSFQQAEAQVSRVDVTLEYNDDTNLYHCYLHILEGEARGVVSRTQFNSQISIVAPANSTVHVVNSYNPIEDNQEFKGSRPAAWTVNATNKGPKCAVGSDFYSIGPKLSPTSQYNTLKEGDKVLLFDLICNDENGKPTECRLFDNTIDPISSADGMFGGDFRVGVTIGGITQLYKEDRKDPVVKVSQMGQE